MANIQHPSNRVQGEGDYESARRYNKRTREHVDKMNDEDREASGPGLTEREGAQARAVGKSRSKAGGQDLRDAEVFRALEKKHPSR